MGKTKQSVRLTGRSNKIIYLDIGNFFTLIISPSKVAPVYMLLRIHHDVENPALAHEVYTVININSFKEGTLSPYDNVFEYEPSKEEQMKMIPFIA